ncbi:hypothetical protein [Rathayibacter rubneri]|nr:hypothetical protein [Rathayibacter rubneri]
MTDDKSDHRGDAARDDVTRTGVDSTSEKRVSPDEVPGEQRRP